MLKGVFLLVWAFLNVSLLAIEQHPFLSEQGVYPYYRYIVKHTDGNQLHLYEKDLDFLRVIADELPEVKHLSIDFSHAFVLGEDDSLAVYSLDSHLAEPLLILEGVKQFDVTDSTMLVSFNSGELKRLDYRDLYTFWSRNQPCDDLRIIAGSEQLLCLDKRSLLRLDPQEAELLGSYSLSKGDWSIESSWLRAAVVKTEDSPYLYRYQGDVLSPIESDISSALGWVRQKELLLMNNDNQLFSCYDVESKQSRWMHFFETPQTLLAVSDSALLLKEQEANTIRVWDHFQGKALLTVEIEQLPEGKAQAFYLYKQRWYLHFSDSVITIEQNEDTTNKI